MAEEISQRELRNDSGRVLRALDEGQTFVITRNREPVGELRPLRRRRLVDAHVVVETFRHAPAVDAARFRADIDALADQDPAPRS
ncbi:hypothetical protein ACWDTP_30270 [Mycobacterium sp. NPDC003449]